MENIKAFLATLTSQPGIYQMLDEDGNILYVGKARNLKKRVSSYFNKTQKDNKTLALVKHIKSIEVIVTRSENEALLLESNLIKKLKPHYNILFRDDKSYPYIFISTNHAYSRIDIYRGQKKAGGHYFGPYPNATAVRETINLIQKIFLIRTCTDSFFSARKRPCLLHQIGRCSGPCVELVSKEEYQQSVRHAILFLEGKNDEVIKELEQQMERASSGLDFESAAFLRDQIAKLREIQERQYINSAEGDADVIGFHSQSGAVCIQLSVIRGGRMLGSRPYFPQVRIAATDEEILTAFIAQHYLIPGIEIPKEILVAKNLPERTWLANVLSEQAGFKVVISTSVRGERRKWVELANANAKQTAVQYLTNKVNMEERFVTLQSVLDLQVAPNRIECFDISHTMGEETVGSCVVFNREGAVKSDYRRFNIKGITPGNDIAAMEQVLRRRYQRIQSGEGKLPDLVLIDGGIAQLHIAEKVFKELNITTVFLIGVAKGATRKPGYETLHFVDEPPIQLSSDSLALHLIQQIRDEAHRFAITGHRLRRDKKRHTSTLENIPGIGAKRRRELLRYFGGIQGLNRASLEEIEKVPGISSELALRIFEVLHG